MVANPYTGAAGKAADMPCFERPYLKRSCAIANGILGHAPEEQCAVAVRIQLNSHNSIKQRLCMLLKPVSCVATVDVEVAPHALVKHWPLKGSLTHTRGVFHPASLQQPIGMLQCNSIVSNQTKGIQYQFV